MPGNEITMVYFMRPAAIFIPLLVLCAPSAQALSAGYPDMRIVLSPPEKHVDASFFERKVVFEGTVTVDNPSNLSLHIQLWGNLPAMNVICSPDYFLLRDSGDQPFNLTITVTKNIFNATYELWVDGEAELSDTLVASNQSNRVKLTIGPRPLAGDGEVDYQGLRFGDGNRAIMMQSLLVAAVMAAIAISAIYATRRRRRRREARQ